MFDMGLPFALRNFYDSIYFYYNLYESVTSASKTLAKSQFTFFFFKKVIIACTTCGLVLKQVNVQLIILDHGVLPIRCAQAVNDEYIFCKENNLDSLLLLQSCVVKESCNTSMHKHMARYDMLE